ncbi:Ig-like domain-containing protein, partial [Vibrio hepatarius]|uniref:Ig-like domain-containing protein n=1 Tax=Vibrio hepatarius TaxID=171383 RepID=UPI00142D59ED
MGIGTYVALVNLASRQKVVVDANGLVRVLLEGEEPKPGEVVLQQLNDDASIEAELAQDNGQSQDLTAELEDIFAALEEGADPTQLGEDFATAAGGQLSSSSTQLGTIERNSAEVVVSTDFSTEGFANLGLSETQSLSLLEQYQLLRQGSTAVEVNSSPIGQDLALTTLEDEELDGRIIATDSDGDSLTYTAGETPTNGSVVVNEDGTWTYTPDPDFNGEDSFTVIVSDGKGGTDEITVNVGVTAVNDAPELTITNVNDFTEDQTSAGDVVATFTTFDKEGDEVTVILSDEVHYALDGNGNVVLTEKGAELVNQGQDLPKFTLTPDDGKVSGEAQSHDPSVTSVNDAPELTITQANNFVEDNGAKAGSVVATFTTFDEDGDTVNVTLSDTTHYALDGNGNVVLTEKGAELVNQGQDLPK